MRKISTAIYAFLLSSSCYADSSPKGQWVFDRDIIKNQGIICSMTYSPIFKSGINNIVIKQFSASDSMNITLYKDTWNIPRGATVVTTLDFMDNQPLTLDSYGDGKIVDIEIPRMHTYTFLSLVRDSSFIQIGFPEASEATWTVPLRGSANSLKQLVACSLQLTKQKTRPP